MFLIKNWFWRFTFLDISTAHCFTAALPSKMRSFRLSWHEFSEALEFTLFSGLWSVSLVLNDIALFVAITLLYPCHPHTPAQNPAMYKTDFQKDIIDVGNSMEVCLARQALCCYHLLELRVFYRTRSDLELKERHPEMEKSLAHYSTRIRSYTPLARSGSRLLSGKGPGKYKNSKSLRRRWFVWKWKRDAWMQPRGFFKLDLRSQIEHQRFGWDRLACSIFFLGSRLRVALFDKICSFCIFLTSTSCVFL